jgi:CRP-like cAMP-binding protein
MKSQRAIEKDPRINRILGRLPADEWSRLAASACIVTLKHAQVLFKDDEPSDMAYFPLTAIVSMIALLKDGREIEYGTIGREGMIGLQVALGSQPLRGEAMVQLEGEAAVFDGAFLRNMREDHDTVLHALLLRYAQATINVLAQSTACNAVHTIRERAARWILMTRDRAGGNEFPLTQEFLSKMLGVRRAGINDVAREFQQQGLITYAHGHMEILDGEALEKAACECYEIVTEEYEHIFD